MCLTLPGRVLSVEGTTALVEKAGSVRWYSTLLHPELAAGDRVIVHAGLVLEVLSKEQALAMEAALAELSMLDQQLTDVFDKGPPESD